MIDKFLEAIEDGNEYDFIANNYTSMSKAELKDILLEYIYAIRRVPHNTMNFSADVTEYVRDELQSREVFG